MGREKSANGEFPNYIFCVGCEAFPAQAPKDVITKKTPGSKKGSIRIDKLRGHATHKKHTLAMRLWRRTKAGQAAAARRAALAAENPGLDEREPTFDESDEPLHALIRTVITTA
eukprot:1981484-Prymnesium_polylepis.2